MNSVSGHRRYSHTAIQALAVTNVSEATCPGGMRHQLKGNGRKAESHAAGACRRIASRRQVREGQWSRERVVVIQSPLFSLQSLKPWINTDLDSILRLDSPDTMSLGNSDKG